jgi:hypothetical protein
MKLMGTNAADTFHGHLEATSINSVNSPLRRPISVPSM